MLENVPKKKFVHNNDDSGHATLPPVLFGG